MSTSRNVDVVQQFVEKLWNRRDLDMAEELFASDCHTHQLRSGAPVVAVPRGPDAMRAHVSEWHKGFPDLRFEIEQMIAEGDRVMSQLVMNGTHTGTWSGIPATGRRVAIRMITIHRIRDGKIIEDWALVESLGFFQGIGVLPPTNEFIAGFVKRPTASQ
jgi:steroid delta-isomerase-like uncharacterized protein